MARGHLQEPETPSPCRGPFVVLREAGQVLPSAAVARRKVRQRHQVPTGVRQLKRPRRPAPSFGDLPELKLWAGRR